MTSTQPLTQGRPALCAVTLIDRRTGRPHRVNGAALVALSRDPHGAAAELPRIRELCQARLGWDDPRWVREQQNYQDLWQRCYSLPADPAMRTPA